ncbi:MAG: hypothetical protein ACPG5B_11970 [Chitinophagales bacterium]
MTAINLYKSVLQKLSVIPPERLAEVDVFLTTLSEEITMKEKKHLQILELAGSWSDMPQEDFDDYMKSIKAVKKNMFNREINLEE